MLALIAPKPLQADADTGAGLDTRMARSDGCSVVQSARRVEWQVCRLAANYPHNLEVTSAALGVG